MSLKFWGIVIAILVVFGVVIAIEKSHDKNNHNNIITLSASGTTKAPSSVVNDISSVPVATLESIGTGSAAAMPSSINSPALTENQKPEIFYEGAEYCPYCATERWAMAVSLARFGTFSNLKLTKSSSTDVYPGTNTLSFYGSTYSSKYIEFNPVEIYSNIPSGGGYTALQTPTAQEQNLTNKYDSGGGIPFIDFGGKYTISGATYNPQTLSGYSWTQIASSLSNPKSSVARGVDGAANGITAAICKLTDNNPGSVCDPTIQAIENRL